MSGYSDEEDVLPCPEAPKHEWVPVDIAPQPDGVIMTCGRCKAFLTQRWWGYEFHTGTELFT